MLLIRCHCSFILHTKIDGYFRDPEGRGAAADLEAAAALKTGACNPVQAARPVRVDSRRPVLADIISRRWACSFA